MRIEWAIPCRYVELGDNGTTATIVGGPVDSFWVRDLPAQIGLMVAIRVIGHADEFTEQHELEVRLVKPDQSEEEKLRAPFGPMPEPPPLAQPGLETGFLVSTVVAWEVEDRGLCTLELYIDGKRERSLPIQVRDPAELESGGDEEQAEGGDA